MENAEKLVYTVLEVATLLQISKNLVHEPSHRKGFPSLKLGKKIIIPKKALEEYINKRLRAAYYLLLGSGVRMGELLPLNWNMVDLENGLLKIRKTLNRLKTLDSNSPTKTKLVFQEPKSASGNRNIPISPNIVRELKQHLETQEKEKALAYGFYSDTDLVFCTSIGTPLDPRSLIRDLHRICKKNYMERLSVHSLRHSFASRLLEKNQHPKIVQELLGHSNISITLDAYSHVMPELKSEAINSLDDLFDSNDVQNNEG